MPEVEQPDASAPVHQANFGGPFGLVSGESSWAEPGRISLVVGAALTATSGGRLYITDQQADAAHWGIAVYNADTRAKVGVWTSGLWKNHPIALAYDDGELYMLGNASDTARPFTLRVYDEQGGLNREFSLAEELAATGVPGESVALGGIDVAWGEVWVTLTGAVDGKPNDFGQQIAIFDAHTGALKGRIRQPSDNAWAQDESWPLWWDISIAPELDSAIVRRRLFSRFAALPGLPVSDAPDLACATDPDAASEACAAQAGTDAAAGMNWFLEVLPSPTATTRGKVREYALSQSATGAELGALGDGLLPHVGYSLAKKREWLTQGVSYASDIAYLNRDTRVDWSGPLTESNWLRGSKCLDYVVSDADVFVAGANAAQHLYEPARNFQGISLKIDGQTLRTSSNATGTFCLDTPTEVTNGSHTLTLEATVAGKTVTATNPGLRVDNLGPAGTIGGAPDYVRDTVTIGVTATDAHSGPKTSELELQSVGGSWQRICGPLGEPDAAGTYSCAWNTNQYADGSYNLRGKITDNASDGGNVGYTPQVATFVDNHDPTLSTSGGLPDRANRGLPIFEDESPPVEVSAGDPGGSGVVRIEFFVDGLKRAGVEQDCRGCGMNHRFLFDPTQVETGSHTAKIVVTDRAGRTREASWTVRVWRNPPDTPDESDTDSLDGDSGASSSTGASTASVPDGLGSAGRGAVQPNVVESEGGSALGQLPPLECDADDPYVVNDHLDYPAPSELGLPIGSTAPDVAVAAYLLGAANLPPIPPTVFREEVATDLERFYSVQIDGRRRAWVLLGRTPTGGWQGNYFGACSEFVDTYFWASTLPEVTP